MFDSLAYAIALLTITDVSRFLKGDRNDRTVPSDQTTLQSCFKVQNN